MEDKLGVLRHLGGRADAVLVGGKMAEQLRVANPLEFPVELPVDVVGSARFEADAESQICSVDALPDGWLGLDIGPRTRAHFAGFLRGARTIFWNGPMGVFEWPQFAAGTRSAAEAVAGADAYSVVGVLICPGGFFTEFGLPSGSRGRRQVAVHRSNCLEGKEPPGVAVIPSA